MKSRAARYTKKEIQWMCDEVYAETERCINANGLVFIIALARHAGWGKKRIEDFILSLNDTMDEYHQHSIDGVFDIMAKEELERIGAEIELPKPLKFSQEIRKSKAEKEVRIDISEAKRLHEELSGFKNYFANPGGIIADDN